jgi:hypothetical protein
LALTDLTGPFQLQPKPYILKAENMVPAVVGFGIAQLAQHSLRLNKWDSAGLFWNPTITLIL